MDKSKRDVLISNLEIKNEALEKERDDLRKQVEWLCKMIGDTENDVLCPPYRASPNRCNKIPCSDCWRDAAKKAAKDADQI